MDRAGHIPEPNVGNAVVVLVGSIYAPAEVELLDGIQWKELTIVGARRPRAPLESAAYYPWSQHRNREVFMELMRRGVVRCGWTI